MCGACIEVKNSVSACTRGAFYGLNTFKRNNKTRLSGGQRKQRNLLFLLSSGLCGIEAPSQLQELLQGDC